MTGITYLTNGLKEFNEDPRFKFLQGQNQVIAIVDSGIRLDNHALAERVIKPHDIDHTGDKDGTSNDTSGHGTWVASIAASVAKKVKLLSVQVSGKNGGVLSNLTDALERILNSNDLRNRLTVVNLSLGDGGIYEGNFVDPLPDWSEHAYLIDDDYNWIPDEIFKAFDDLGIVITAAAGNGYQFYESKEGVTSFAAYKTTIPVAASDSDGVRNATALASFSQRRSDCLVAPGNGISVLTLNNTIAKGKGTSFATPFISGVCVLLQHVSQRYLKKRLTPLELITLLRNTSDNLEGYKSVNVYKAALEVIK